jgi:hypothetical protein
MFAECDAAFGPAGNHIEDVLPWFDIADGYAVWRRLRQSKPDSLGKLECFVSELDAEPEDEYDEYGEEVEKKTVDEGEGGYPRQAVVKKWIGLLTQRQQNRLASRQEAAA